MSTLSRFPNVAGADNTDRIRNNEYLTPAYAATIALLPTKSRTLVNVAALTGALTVTMGVGTSTTAPYVGDEVIMLFTAAADRIVTFGTGTLPTATLTVLAAKTANVKFIFNGAAWCEVSRAVTA